MKYLTALIMSIALTTCSAGTADARPSQGDSPYERHTAHTFEPHKSAPVPARAVPCVYEDGSGGPLPCYWDAGDMGNGVGNSFWIDRRDRTHYLNPVLDFRERMKERGYKRVRSHTVPNHRVCYEKVGPTSIVRCFDGLYLIS